MLTIRKNTTDCKVGGINLKFERFRGIGDEQDNVLKNSFLESIEGLNHGQCEQGGEILRWTPRNLLRFITGFITVYYGLLRFITGFYYGYYGNFLL